MPPSAKVKAAFQAMENIGIPKHKTKPALKKLLKLFDKNWDLIEEENYRVLADTIFEYEETEAAEKEKKVPANNDPGDMMEEESTPLQEEPERPLKRLRLKHQDQQPSSNSGGLVLKVPKPEPGEPEASFDQWAHPTTGSHQRNVRNGTTESQPIVRDKGKRPISRVSPAPVQRAPQALQIKERKPESGPGRVVSRKQKQDIDSMLIIPKDEPFTDDMLLAEPLAVVRPEPPCQEPPSQHSNPVDGQAGKGTGTSISVNGVDKSMERAAQLITKENHLKESDSPTIIDVASSSLGEVKICLKCSHGVKPDLQVVLKEVEDNCIKTYKVTNPEFSITNVMKQICECALEHGTHVTQEKLNPDDVGNNGTCCLSSTLNGSINEESSDKVANPGDIVVAEASDPPLASNCPQMSSENHCIENLDMQGLYDPTDITRGKETVKVSLETSNSEESLPPFHYISQNVISHNAKVMFSLADIGDKDCCISCHGDCSSLSSTCNCVKRNGGESQYMSDGLVRETFLEECISTVRNPQKQNLKYCKECPLERSKNEDMLDPCKGHLKRKFIKECWTKCGCSKFCGNRVVQKGIRGNLQVFWTPEGKGWGLRTLEEIPKGAFVCEYVGEILTNAELHKRNMSRRNKHSYSVLLDTDWGSRALKEDELLCLDATFYGNVSRFINHRCSDANLIQIPVEVETPKHHYYHVALFTTRKVDAFEELTWDYGVDFDDNELHIKAFRCLCGSKFCRNMKRSTRSRSSLTLS